MRADIDTESEPLREVGGYRVVRTLASDRHGTRLLVHAGGHAWVARVFAYDCSDAVIDHEMAVSDVVRSSSGPLAEHVVAIHDLCTTNDGRIAFIEPYLAGPRLDTLLRTRHDALTLGEAVTILAPLASAVDQGHHVGLTGLLAEAADVRLTASGAPIVTRRSGVRLGPALPDRFRDREPGYAADRDAFERVGAAVAATMGGDEQAALLSTLRLRAAPLHFALFDLAQPQPVRHEAKPDTSTGRPERSQLAQNTVVRAARAVGEDYGRASEARPLPLQGALAALSASLTSLGLPDGVVSAVDDTGSTIARQLSRCDGWVRQLFSADSSAVRPRFFVAGAIGAAAFIAAIVAGTLSSSSEPMHADHSPEVVETPPLAMEDMRIEPGLAETELHPSPEVWRPLVEELLQRWSDCSLALGGGDTDPESFDCGASVVHAGSAAAVLLTADDPRHELVRDWLGVEGDVVVVERMGAAVLLDLMTDTTTTASLLVVRSEAGWRIRDVIG